MTLKKAGEAGSTMIPIGNGNQPKLSRISAEYSCSRDKQGTGTTFRIEAEAILKNGKGKLTCKLLKFSN